MDSTIPVWAVLWSLAGFLLGAIPFSVWIGHFLVRKEIRVYGDHNPGATNVLRAGGFLPFTLALLLDIGKGALPVGLAYYILGIQNWWIVPVALAPPLGHAFSPFLHWQGGKAIAATLGIWIGLTIWVVPLVGTVLLIVFSLSVRPSGWALFLTLAGVGLFLLFWNPSPIFMAVLAGTSALLIWKHREDLGQRPQLRFTSGQDGNR